MKSGPPKDNATGSHQWKGHVNQEEGGKAKESGEKMERGKELTLPFPVF